MFYSETLLSKTGPLARVWLSANLERKLNKSNILQTNLEDSVNAIMDQGQAPMALRLSGQLLLGVARIYSRKARYLMDDCNEALVKIKMAFRPGNNLDLDLATLNPEIAAPNTLMPDIIAGEIPSLPILDESLFAGGKGFDLPGLDDPLNWNSQLVSTPERGRRAPERAPSPLYDGSDLDIDLGLDMDKDIMSPERSRRAEPERPDDGDSLLRDNGELYKDALDIDFGLDGDDDTFNMGIDGDQMDVDELPEENLEAGLIGAGNGSASPLSSARSSVAREVDHTFLTADAEEPSISEQRQPVVKKRKILPIDEVTEIKQQQIKDQQADRSSIIKPPSMLPKDPVLLALMEMQRKGLFVSSIMGDGRSRGWAPELRGVLSIEVIRKNAGVKRKRREVEDIDREEETSLQLEIPADDSLAFPAPTIDITADEDGLRQGAGDEQDDDDHIGPAHDTFDDTTLPLVHPEDQGPISQGTHHAVHLLRDHFGGADESGAQSTSGGSKQARQNVIFQNMFPESQTTKADATKMFFEVLVLATKDAIKVDQAEDVLGGPIKIRAKRGLWGSWAEEKAGGEAFGTQAEAQTVDA